MIYGIPHHTRDRDAGPWRKPCPRLGRRRSFDGRMRDEDCPRLAPRGSSVFAPACTPGSFACVPPACTPGVFCCAAVCCPPPVEEEDGSSTVEHEQEEVHTRSRGLRVPGAGSSLHPARLPVHPAARSARCLSRAPPLRRASSRIVERGDRSGSADENVGRTRRGWTRRPFAPSPGVSPTSTSS